MADALYIPAIESLGIQRHSALVRITHWLNAVSFIGLVVSGVGIILAHPRFYWGETGGVGTPSLFDLPLPFMLGGPSGWGRYLHFQSAWLCVLSGLAYLASGPWSRPNYERLQRLTYRGVVFLCFPLMIWTGLAMSPAVTSVFPFLVNVLGGHQTARTVHFFAAVLLVLFLFAHLTMVTVSGFRKHVSAMITGRL